MLSPRALTGDQLRLSLPVLSTNKHLLPSRPQLQRTNVLKLDEEVVCTLGEDISLIPSGTHSTMRHLRCRHTEVSQWQAQISDSIGRMDQEITAVEQVKLTAEACLQEKQVYSQHMSECLALNNSQNPEVPRRDSVLIELKKEDQLNNKIRELLHKNISILVNKISSLKEIRAQLLADFQDKDEAIKLTTKCITHDLNGPSSRLPDSQCKPSHVSYDTWLSHCRDLRLTAENLMKDSFSFRGNMHFTLANMKNAQQHQCHSTDEAMQKKINELSKEKSYITLTLEKHDLAKMAAGFHTVLKRCQQDLELTHGRLKIVEDKLAKNTRALEVVQKCQQLHQSFLPVPNTASRPRLCTTTTHPTALSYLS